MEKEERERRFRNGERKCRSSASHRERERVADLQREQVELFFFFCEDLRRENVLYL